MIVGFQGPVIKTPLCYIYIQYANKLNKVLFEFSKNNINKFVTYTYIMYFFFCRLKLLCSNFSRLKTFFQVFLFLGFIFFRTFIPENLLTAPHTILGKKRPRNLKHRTLIPMTFFPRTSENSNFFPEFLFPGFFSWNFFPRTSLHRFIQNIARFREAVCTYPQACMEFLFNLEKTEDLSFS